MIRLAMRLVATLCLAGLLTFAPGSTMVAPAASAQQVEVESSLPPISIDALDNDTWSVSEVVAAPGQSLIVTNRGVEQHTFTVPDWGINVPLPSLDPVEIPVPDDAQPGDLVGFLCSSADHRHNGQTGTIVIVAPDVLLASLDGQANVASTVENRAIIETGDDFSFSPDSLEVAPGGLIEVRNNGVIEHHFVVDEWGINETVSPGDVTIVEVPPDVSPGDRFTFYCSVPGHRASGMEGTISIGGRSSAGTTSGTMPSGGPRSQVADLGRFMPGARTFGDGWTQLRSGSASSVVEGPSEFDLKVFPGDGLGAAFVGPSGSRATVIVMPFSATAVPANQVRTSVLTLQASMTQGWNTDPHASGRLEREPPPRGCDVAVRESGVAPIFTLPAGSTVCQIRNAGVAIFVTVEGEIDEASGVEAADTLVTRLLSGM